MLFAPFFWAVYQVDYFKIGTLGTCVIYSVGLGSLPVRHKEVKQKLGKQLESQLAWPRQLQEARL